ncbi:MAG: hypothetical protein AMS27_07235, partial [Bacteroides sp. SM23_62_1]
MVKKLPGILLIVFVTILIIDLYVYSGLFWLIESLNIQLLKSLCSVFYWLIPLFFAATFGISINKFIHSRSPLMYSSLFRYVGLFILFYIPKITFVFFLLIQDIFTLIYAGVVTIFNFDNTPVYNGFRNSIFNFISESALLLSVLIFLIISYGITFGRFNFKVRRIILPFKTLPDAFDGFRIIHISDLHAGSMGRLQHKIMKAIRLINDEKPDLILFTGDMVNDFAEELDGWEEVLTGLKATYGKFSILGNHDYGEYYPW